MQSHCYASLFGVFLFIGYGSICHLWFYHSDNIYHNIHANGNTEVHAVREFTLERQGQGDSLQILLLKGTKTHKFQNANPEDISLPHPNSCVLPSAL